MKFRPDSSITRSYQYKFLSFGGIKILRNQNVHTMYRWIKRVPTSLFKMSLNSNTKQFRLTLCQYSSTAAFPQIDKLSLWVRPHRDGTRPNFNHIKATFALPRQQASIHNCYQSQIGQEN